MDLVLDPGSLPHQMGPPGDRPAQRACSIIRQPHRWQKVCGQQLREDSASILSVLTFASAIAPVFDGFDTTTTTTRATIGVSRFAIASLLPVASKALHHRCGDQQPSFATLPV
jgi:hypothetical protein